MLHPDDTIAAIASGTDGAVGIVRISGPEAEPLLGRLVTGLPDQPQSHRLYYGHLVGAKGVVDEIMAVLMRQPRSFTGEDVVEIHCHGGALNLRTVLEAVLAAGARQAGPGEFSMRAFLNGRIDLTQAEAIADIIDAESQEALRVAQAQLGGNLRQPIERLRQQVLDLLTLIEASLDFAAEEHVYQMPIVETVERLDAVRHTLERMLAAYQSGRVGLHGARLVFVGEPNVGKSSLFNRFAGADRAIVTDVPGTTRDVLETATAVGGRRIQLVDTAGLRESADVVERIGVERTRDELRIADVVAWVVEADADLPPPPEGVEDAWQGGRLVLVANKVDRLSAEARAQLGDKIAQALPEGLRGAPVVGTSAITGAGLAALENEVAVIVSRLQARAEGDVPLLTSIRHATAMQNAVEALERATTALQDEMPLELAATDVRDAADALGEIVGAIGTDDVLNAIFSSFCVGK